MTISIKKALSLLLFFFLLLAGCRPGDAPQLKKPVVAVSIVPVASFVKEVAGDLVDVVTVIPAGRSPETYSPSPQELEKLSRSSVYFTIRMPAEEAYILPRLKEINRNVKTVNMAAEVAKIYPDREFAPSARDPHIWLSPRRAAVMVEIISRELCALDEGNSRIYRENASKYIDKLKDLEGEIKRLFSGKSNRTFIIYHPSLGYFADDYGLTMLSVEEEGREASPRDLERIVDTAREKGIKTVFYQQENDSRQSKVLASEIGGEARAVAPLAPDYIENMRKMALAIAEAL